MTMPAMQDVQDAQEAQDVQGSRDMQDVQDSRDMRDVRHAQDAQDTRDVQGARDMQDIQDTQAISDMPVVPVLPRPDRMERLKRMLLPIVKVIPPGSQIAYLDYPVHENIGDLLIMKGTELFFREHRIRVRKRLCLHQFRVGMRLPQDWILVFHGGGNFGDLYPDNQRFREQVARAYPQHRIVVLPQTVHFADASQQERSLRLLGEHPDFHLFVRDTVSYDTVKEKLANVYLAPDMAHQLYPIQRQRGTDPGGRRGTLGLLRTDGEAGPQSAGLAAADLGTDWPALLTWTEFLALRLLVIGFRLDRYLFNLLPLRPLWYRMAERWIGKARRLYSDCDEVVTSRLHGHLLACLMNVPNRLIDNSYGKNMNYYRTWTHVAAREGMPRAAADRNDAGDLYAESS